MKLSPPLSQLPDPLSSRSRPLAQWRVLGYHMVASFPKITRSLSLPHSKCWPVEQPHLNCHEGTGAGESFLHPVLIQVDHNTIEVWGLFERAQQHEPEMWAIEYPLEKKIFTSKR